MQDTQETITIFHARKTTSKVPASPFGDNTFVFETHPAETNLQMFTVMVSSFILNLPLDIHEPTRTFRRKVNVAPYSPPERTYIILDIDEVRTKDAQTKILEYFKPWRHILGESRSHNSLDNFNLKGILFTTPIPAQDIKLALSGIHHDLREHCNVDESAARVVQYTAPIGRSKVIENREDAPRWEFRRTTTTEHIRVAREQFSSEKISASSLRDIQAGTIDSLCLQVFQSMGFVALDSEENESISFRHPSEKRTPGGFYWFSTTPYTMRHPNSTRSVDIFDSIRKLPLARELMRKQLNYDVDLKGHDTSTEVLQVNEAFLKVTPKVREKVENFLGEKDGLLSIRSPMGTAKSTIILHVIEEAHALDMRVLVITNRISVAEDFGKKYGMKVYNQDKYTIGDSLICQFDSLHKRDIRHFDVVVMDEFLSLMMHARSSLNSNAVNITKYFAAFRKKLVIADAFLTGFENFLLREKKQNLHQIKNNYRDGTTLWDYENKNHFIKSLIHHAGLHKITVSATSLQFIHSLSALLQDRGLKVTTLTAETPASTKKLIYELMELPKHDKWDVLIFSPTLTVGVSNLNTVPHHFHLDSSRSTDVISSLQMIKRTRGTREIHLFVQERVRYIKTTYDALRDQCMGNIGRNADQNYLFDIDDDANPRLSRTGKKALMIDTFQNILEFDHRRAFLWLLKQHFRYDPRVVPAPGIPLGNPLGKYSSDIREDSKKTLVDSVQQFIALSNIERTNLLMDTDAPKALRTISEIDESIEECQGIVRAKILECALRDGAFLQKAWAYKILSRYCSGTWDSADVKALVSRAVIRGKNDDLAFLNAVLKRGAIPIQEQYLPRTISRDPSLKFLLTKAGYKTAPVQAGRRAFICDPSVLEFYQFIK